MKIEIKKTLVKNWFKVLQDIICNEIEEIEKNSIKFVSKDWKKSANKDEGGGEYRIIENGKIFDKVGVNYSEVYGKFSKEFRKKIPGTNINPKFWASGISVVMHMKNPHVPALHFNTRYIQTSNEWFGGGVDSTPCFKDKKYKKWFHNELKLLCNRHDRSLYKKYSKWCDEYFFLTHRKESRGIGGIFFDYKKDNWEKDFAFVRDLGLTFKELFKKTIKNKNKKMWSSKDKEIQYYKRGRYVEFNLLYDRGTKFGLQTGGNVEAIFMSLPPIAKWK